MTNDPNQETLLARWLADNLTPAEREAIAEDKSIEALRIVTEDISSWKLPAMDVDQGLARLKAALGREVKETVQLQPFGYAMRIAAAVTLLIIGYLGWQFFFNAEKVYETGIAERMDIELPDKSLVTLDANTRLSFDASGWDDIRLLTMQGQAFFDVEKGGQFSVVTKVGTVTVLGTEFNVKQFDSDLTVVCYEGSVKVESPTGQVILKPTEGVSFEDDTIKTFVTDETLPDWQQGFTRFSQTSLIQVMKELERRFDARIQLPNKYNNLRYSGAVPFTSLEDALQAVCLPMELENQIGDDGNVSIR